MRVVASRAERGHLRGALPPTLDPSPAALGGILPEVSARQRHPRRSAAANSSGPDLSARSLGFKN